MTRRLLVLTTLIAVTSPCYAVSYVWNFAANAPCDATPANPVDLCNADYGAATATFTDTTATYDITARGYDLGTGTSPLSLVVGTTTWTVASMAPNNDLWAKFNGNALGADETGLGVATPNTGGDREIEKTNFIQLDLTGLPADAQSVDLMISSLQTGETATVWGSDTLGQPGLLLASFVGPGAGGAAVTTFHYDLAAGHYLTVSANPNQSGPNNVLIGSGLVAAIPTTTTSSTTTTRTTSSTTSTTATTSTTSTTTTSTTTSSTTTSSTSTTTPGPTTTTTMPPYQCYEVDHATFSLPGASLSNQFGSSTADVSTPKRLCNPADLNGADAAALNDPGHLVGYTLVHTSPPFVPVNGLSVTNALGTFVVAVVRPVRLFVPSAKSLSSPPPPLSPASVPDHFECYKATGGRLASAVQVAMQDEFGTQAETVLKFEQLCVPVNVNGSGIPNPALKLMCYRSKYTGARFRGPGGPVFVNNEFGAATLQASHGEELCLPSS